MALTTLGGNGILDSLVSGAPWLALGLNDSTPTVSGDNFHEPSTAYGYARQNISSLMGAASNKTKTNNSIIFFPEDETTDWGTVMYFGLFTAETGGNLILFGQLSSSVAVAVNYVPIFRVNALQLSIV